MYIIEAQFLFLWLSGEPVLTLDFSKFAFSSFFAAGTKNGKRGRVKGGLACFFNKNIHPLILLYKNESYLFVFHKNYNLVIGSLTANPKANFEDLLEKVSNILVTCKLRFSGCKIILGGT